ncbi:MAG: hypothetical protein KatS3mg108_0375 [Isosphaeraceae bacterium]|jgi:hypothetical protein|nr:MAG: hypothetical protein KatS3mg108_0375 [Isosphaeraceae bacterium]
MKPHQSFALRAGLAVGIALVLIPTARAHYVWVHLKSGAVRVLLSEHPRDEAPGLGTKIAATTATADGSPLTLQKGDDALTAPLAEAARCVEADCDYGTIERQGQRYRLIYHAAAQAIPADLAEAVSASAGDTTPRLLWVGCDESGAARVLAVRGGTPLAGATVKLIPDDGPAQECVTDEHGLVTVPGLERGEVGALLRVVDPAASDSELQARRYASLTAAPETATADLLLERAHEARANWGPGFPGFSADVAIQSDGEDLRGRLVVAADGSVDLQIPEGPTRDWATRQLRSLVMHRGLNGPTVLSPGASFADDDQAHPYGRLIQLPNDGMGSLYRIDGDVIREVHRTHRGRKFINRVLSVTRNAEGKVLPGAYSVAYWDPATGALDRVETFQNRWTRVGRLDLPVEHTQVTVTDGNSTVHRILFSNHAVAAIEAAAR